MKTLYSHREALTFRSLLLWFVPESGREDPILVDRVLNSFVYAGLLGGFGFGYGLMYLLTGTPAILWISVWLTSAVGLALPILYRMGAGCELVAVIGTVVYLIMQVIQIATVGEASWAHAWLVVAPFIGQNIGGFRAGLISGGLGLLALAGVVWARSVGLFAVEPLKGFVLSGVGSEIPILLIVIYLLGVLPSRNEQRVRAQLVLTNASLTEEVAGHQETQTALQNAQSELVRTARIAGMAEVATGVLHNMGNALNTVAVSGSVVRDITARGDLQNRLERTSILLGKPDVDIAAVRRYLDAIARRVHMERDTTLAELDRLNEGVAHVAAVVSAQQRHARGGGLIEDVPLAELVGRAVDLARSATQRAGVVIHVDVGPEVQVVTEAHQVVQVLVNLVRNAADALLQVDGTREIWVSAVREGVGVRIQVRDSGAGVLEEDRERVFGHGFTTKSHGSGFGLHVSALAARSLGGELVLEPQVVGQGACFSLWIPVDGAGARYTSEAGVRSAQSLAEGPWLQEIQDLLGRKDS